MNYPLTLPTHTQHPLPVKEDPPPINGKIKEANFALKCRLQNVIRDDL